MHSEYQYNLFLPNKTKSDKPIFLMAGVTEHFLFGSEIIIFPFGFKELLILKYDRIIALFADQLMIWCELNQ